MLVVLWFIEWCIGTFCSVFVLQWFVVWLFRNVFSIGMVCCIFVWVGFLVCLFRSGLYCVCFGMVHSMVYRNILWHVCFSMVCSVVFRFHFLACLFRYGSLLVCKCGYTDPLPASQMSMCPLSVRRLPEGHHVGSRQPVQSAADPGFL